jgi:translation initiation factor 2 gamma subunit (eIF-2gamma)
MATVDPEMKRIYNQRMRDKRRSRGLCITCGAASVKFMRCLECRKKNSAQKKRCRSRLPLEEKDEANDIA